MSCVGCQGKHKRIPTDRPNYAARYCDQCDIRHSAREVQTLYYLCLCHNLKEEIIFFIQPADKNKIHRLCNKDADKDLAGLQSCSSSLILYTCVIFGREIFGLKVRCSV